METTLSPSKLKRSPSSPSLAHAVGLPPPIPECTMPPPVTPTRSRTSLKRTRESVPSTPSRRGEVETSEDEKPKVKGAVMSPSTPKRKVVNAIEGATPRRKKELQSRLSAVASPRMPRPSALTLTANARTAPSTPGEARNSDKVVVCMRIKPTTSAFLETAYELSPTSLALADQHPNVVRRGGKAGREAEYTYTFDTLVQFPTRTPELYENKIAPLVDKAMKGFNSTVFAYGQTGSGKSHTMSGTRDELGIIPCAVDGIFDAITADTERAFLLRVSYLEIYNEAIRDLLYFKKGPLSDDERPTIHTGKGKITVDPLVEEIVSTPKDVVDLLDKGNTNRKTGATDWNERSSRSHAVFTIVIESRPRESEGEDEIRVSRLTLIDLAGSEKAVSDIERRGEGKHINQSLLALREVVHKLTEKGKRGHIPYRNSKLTHLLENVLGGDSNICVICTMSADEQHCPETLETLKFAGRCSQVETKAQKNILLSSDRAVIRAKDLEIAELKKQLETMGGRTIAEEPEEIMELKDTLADMEARKAKLVSQLAKLNGEILTSELPRSGVGLPVSTPRMKRPRISDLTSLSSGGLGLGTPTPKKAFDRRAVSNMVRVPEELAPALSQDTVIGNLDSSNTFDNDLQLATLRRTIAVKEDNLSEQAIALAAAKEDADQLPSVKAELTRVKLDLEAAESQHASKLQDAEQELEKTRSQLLETIAQNTSKIETLEAAVLDLRKSREELVVEDQQRLNKVQAELDAAVKERDELKKEMKELRDRHQGELSKIKEAIRTLRTQADGYASRATALEGELDSARKGMAASLETLTRERDEARSKHEDAHSKAEMVAATVTAIQTAKDEESKAVVELKDRLDKEQEMRHTLESKLNEAQSEAKTAQEKNSTLEAGLKAATAKLQASEEQHGKLDGDHKALIDNLAAAEAKNVDLTKTIEDVQRQLALALEKNSSLEKDLELKTTDLVSATDRVTALVSSDEDKAAKLEALETDKAELDSQLTEVRTSLEAAEANLNSSEAAAKAREAELQKTSEEVKTKLEAELAKVSDDLAASSTALHAAKQQLATIKSEQEQSTTELASAKTTVEDLTRQLAAKATELDEKAAAHDSAVKEIAALREGASVADSVEADLQTKQSALDKVMAEKDAVSEKLEEALGRVASMEKELTGAKSALANEQAALEKEQTALRETKSTQEQWAKAQAELSAVLDKERGAHDETKATLEQATVAKASVEAELSSAKTTSDEIKAALETEKAAHIASKSKLEDLVSRIAALETNLTSVQKAKDALDAELKDSTSRAKSLKEKLSAAEKAHSGAKDESGKKLEAAFAATAALEQQLQVAKEEHSTATADMKRQLQAAQDAKDAIAADLKEQLETVETASKETEDKLLKELTALRSEIDGHDQTRALLDAQQREYDESLRSLEAERKAREQLATAVDAAKAGIATLEKELDLSRSELSAARARNDRLAAEIVTLSTAAPERSASRRQLATSTSVPDALSFTAEDALRGKGAMNVQQPDVEGWKKSHELEEIDQLDKVVEAQKSVILEQRQKIQTWSEELEKQRELVRLLTQDGMSTSASTETLQAMSTPKRHIRASLSMSSVPSPGSPVKTLDLSPAPPAYASARTRGHISSSFTAKNLALPSAPSPLPMHDRQQHALRKARRITIEHDIDRLQEKSKVNRLKSVFDSPEKEKEDVPPRSIGSRRAQFEGVRRRA